MIPYLGGKFYMAKEIIKRIPSHMTYVEVFGGAGWILFLKSFSKIEVYNDINFDLTNLFLQIRDNFKRFNEKAYWTLNSREFYNFSKNYIFEKNKLMRALQYAIQFTMCFSCINYIGYGYRVNSIRAPNWFVFYKRLFKIKERLKNVIIENLDFEKCISKYDNKNTFFYCDPPYFEETRKIKNYYVFEFSEKDHIRLAKILNNIEGKVLISYFMSPKLKNLYPADKWIYEKFDKAKHINITRKNDKKRKGRQTEFLIRNYELDNLLFPEKEILNI